jgi:hypothetical protein
MGDALVEALVQNKQLRKIEYSYEFLSNMLFLFQGIADRKVRLETHIPEDLTVLRAVAGEDSVVLYAVSKEFGALPPGSVIPHFDLEFKEIKSVILTK